MAEPITPIKDVPDYRFDLQATVNKLKGLSAVLLSNENKSIELSDEEMSGIALIIEGIALDLEHINRGIYGKD
ncbi:MAG: hypothetical protein GY868_11615 [Deltaproteobacteria bacterium]|nr:hypothetical protein [Deltaproteobacteria bacterium]